MNKRRNRKGLVERFCQFLGRQNFASDFLDYISSWLFLQPAFAFNGKGKFPLPKYKEKMDDKLDESRPMLMARPTQWYNGNTGRPPPPVPMGVNEGTPQPESIIPWRYLIPFFGGHVHQKAKDDAKKHAPAPCSDPKYQGMHGQPCKFAGGSDTKCPSGTTSGWFWAYDLPGLGRIYYVDCCGVGGSASDVYCEWTLEADWCNGWGRAANKGISGYNCTLAIPESDMKVVDLGGNKYEVSGVDA